MSNISKQEKLNQKSDDREEKVRLEAAELPEVTDDELEKLAKEALESAKSEPPKTQGVPEDPQTKGPDLKKLQPGWWRLSPEERQYFFSWKDTPFVSACADLEEMSGLSMMGLNLIDAGGLKPITFQSVKLMSFDEALTTFNKIIYESPGYGYWVLRRDGYLVIRALTEWYRHIPPERMYNSVEDYRKAKLPMW